LLTDPDELGGVERDPVGRLADADGRDFEAQLDAEAEMESEPVSAKRRITDGITPELWRRADGPAGSSNAELATAVKDGPAAPAPPGPGMAGAMAGMPATPE
ncbi:MAG TPA: hypothetical protein DEQ61_22630, partial [Streptomyces sp.]|nr:hypothetical protein [Streptomyces sp.]